MINIDWLSFSVRLVFADGENRSNMVLTCPDSCELVMLDGTNIYRKRAFLLTESGEKILTLLWEPHSSIINSDTMFVEVANRWLYGSLEFVKDLLWKVHPYTMHSLSRYDVCCDFNPTDEQMKIIKSLGDNTAYVQGKREGSMFVDYTNAKKIERMPRCLSWGSKCSDVKWKLYNKTLEIFEVRDGKTWCTKPYIVNAWRAEGLDEKKVWRLEVSVTGASQFEWLGKKLVFADAIRREWFEDFFAMMYGTRFITRLNQGHKDRTNDKRVMLLGEVGEIFRLRRREPETSRENVEMASVLRAMMHQLEDIVVKYNPMVRDSLLATAETALDAGKLWDYFHKSYGMNWEKWKDTYLTTDA